jgi:hypothetical protein
MKFSMLAPTAIFAGLVFFSESCLPLYRFLPYGPKAIWFSILPILVQLP